MVQQASDALVGSLVGSQISQKSGAASDYTIGKREVYGLCAVYFAIGTVNGFFNSFIQIPVSLYIFKNNGALYNAAPNIVQMAWSFKLFVGMLIDNFPLFGSRRKNWILFGWTLGLAGLLVAAFTVHIFEEKENLFGYLMVLMGMCFCYIFSDVAVDALAVEYTKLESEEVRGQTLVLGNMIRFVAIMLGSVLGFLFMSGKDYSGSAADDSIVFPFELNYTSIHFMLFLVALPAYVVMWMFLKDPPQTQEHPTGLKGLADAGSRMWLAMKSFAFFMLVVYSSGMNAVGGMGNPANGLIATMASPSNFCNSVGVLFGNAAFVIAIWVFKRYLMHVNWRFTTLWTHGVVSFCAILNIMVIWNIWGAQDPWFYTIQQQVPGMIQGFYFLLLQLATAEISPEVLEATYYELMLSSSNGALTLAVALQNLFIPQWDLTTASNNWVDYHCAAKNGTWSLNDTWASECHTFRAHGSDATWTILIINLCGALAFVWFLPKNGAQCRKWQNVGGFWKTTAGAVFNFVIYFAPWTYGMVQLFIGLKADFN